MCNPPLVSPATFGGNPRSSPHVRWARPTEFEQLHSAQHINAGSPVTVVFPRLCARHVALSFNEQPRVLLQVMQQVAARCGLRERAGVQTTTRQSSHFGGNPRSSPHVRWARPTEFEQLHSAPRVKVVSCCGLVIVLAAPINVKSVFFSPLRVDQQSHAPTDAGLGRHAVGAQAVAH